jgi:hypothetical protein
MKKVSMWVIIIAILVMGIVVMEIFSRHRNTNQIYGVSFNAEYAAYLGLDSDKVFQTILNEWNFKYIRLSATWDEIEMARGIYDFSSLNKLMDAAALSGAKVTLAVGQKIPRWPECHAPSWAASLSDNEYKAAVKRFIKATVDQYKDHPALEIWQVENEPLFEYGECRFFDSSMLSSEIESVKSLDANHKIMITDSGELSSWRHTAKAADLFGTTMYRVVWNERIGYFSYVWLTPLFYRAKLLFAGQKTQNAYISELQAEPWVTNQDVKTMDLDKQYKSMSIERFHKNVDYAQRVGFPRAYLWGAEWWYWMAEKKGVNDFVDFAKTLKKE